MIFKTDYRLEEYILLTKWEDFPKEVRTRACSCSVDLFNALILGSQSDQFRVGASVAQSIFGKGNIPVVGSKEQLSVTGAACAMGHSSNAYDIDDGHNIIRAHPGASFIGNLLAVACETNSSYREFLTALVHSYEATVRMARAIMDFYQHPHGSGTFGPTGAVVGMGRLRGYTKHELQNAISIAEFHGPLVPGGRSVVYPSMCKDGVPFGVIIGMISAAEAEEGFTGNKHLLESDTYRYLTDDLGKNYEIMQLYFKPYSCCRWAHPAIEAVLEVLRREKISLENIETITLHTFEKAVELSKGIPSNTDEAQYNIAYPVSAAILWGDVGMEQLTQKAFDDPRVPIAMSKLRYAVDPIMDAAFPEKRQCQAVFQLKNRKMLTSSICEPRGEAEENIGLPWISDKFKRMTHALISEYGQDTILHLLIEAKKTPVREIVETINNLLF